MPPRTQRSFITVDAVGSREMQRMFQHLGKDGIRETIIAPTLDEGSALLERDVEHRIPVRTGKLKNTLRRKVNKMSARVSVGDSSTVETWNRGGASKQLAVLLEYGTAKMPAQPFMRPALDNSKRGIEAIAVKHMQRALEMFKRGGKVMTFGGSGRYKASKAP